MNKHIHSLLLALTLAAPALHAQSTDFTYQGTLTDGGSAASGDYDFQFTLKDALTAGADVGIPATVTLNTVPVTGGVFTVTLDFGAPAFDGTDRWLEIAVQPSGGGGFTTLTPRQPIHPTPYALHATTAQGVPDGGITAAMLAAGSVSSDKLADGAVTSTQLGAGAVQANNLADSAVQANHLAANAVTTAAIADGAITANKLSNGYSNGPDLLAGLDLTTTPDFATFSATFPEPFATGTTPTVTLPAGWTLDGPPTETGFSATAPFAPVTLDSAGAVGYYSSMALVDGRPAIAYFDDTSDNLKYIIANDAGATTWAAPVIVDEPGNVGAHCAMVVINGRPAIVYEDRNNQLLKYAIADDASGANWTIVTVDSSLVARSMSLALVDGHPAVSYRDHTTEQLKYARAPTADGTGIWTVVTLLDNPATPVGPGTSLAVVAGRPAISYQDFSIPGQEKHHLIRADDAIGTTTWGSPVVASNVTGQGTSTLAVVDGHPALSFRGSPTAVYYVRATDPEGTAWGPEVQIDNDGNVGEDSTLAMIAGRLVISYRARDGGLGSSLRFAIANDSTGTDWGPPVVVDPDPLTGTGGMRFPSLLDLNGRLAIAYFDDYANHLKFAHLPPFPEWTATGGTVFPIIAAGVADGGITAAMLAAGSVSSDKLADGAVGSTQLASGAVQASNLALQAAVTNLSADGIIGVNGGGLVGIGTGSPDAALHVAHGRVVEVFTVRDGNGGYNLLNNPRGVAIDGTTAYVTATTDDALTIIDVTNPASPVLLAEVRDGVGGFNFLNGAHWVAVSGGLAYVAAEVDDSLTIIDVSDPANPVLVAAVRDGVTPGFNDLDGARFVTVSGNFAYVSANGDNAVTIIDVSTPASPTVAAVLKDGVTPGFDELDGPFGMAVSGNHLYITSSIDASLTIVDVTNPAAPVFRSVVKHNVTPGFDRLVGARSVAISADGNTAFVAANNSDALSIIDVTDKANPALLTLLQDGQGGYTQLNNLVQVALSGTTAYLAANTDDALTIVDVSDPANPVRLEVVDHANGGINGLNAPWGLAVSGSTAYLTSNQSDRFTIIDFDPTRPGLVVDDWVGIGTSAPQSALDVSGTVTGTAFAGDGSSLTNLSGANLANDSITSAALDENSIGLWDTDGTAVYRTSGRVGIGTSTPTHTLHIYKGDSGGNGAASAVDMVIEDNDNSILQINGGTSGQIRFGRANQWASGAITYDSNNTLKFDSGSSTRLSILSDGKVGIGTTTPATKLDVNGTVTATGFSGDGAALTNLSGTSLAAGSITAASLAPGAANDADADPTDELQTLSLVGNDLTLSNGGGTTDLAGIGPWITSGGSVHRNTGDVGIGTSGPAARLHIFNGDSGEEALTPSGEVFIESNGATFLQLASPPSYSAGIVFERSTRGIEAGLIYDESADLDLRTDNKTRLTVKDAGNVGIRTTTPAAALHVYNGDSGQDVYSFSDMVVEDNSSAYIQLNCPEGFSAGLQFGRIGNNMLADDNYANIVLDDEKKLKLRNGGNFTRMTILPDGKVGIGTTSPTEKLHVDGNVKCTTAIITSDRNKKAGFEDVDPREVLDKVTAMPITRWHYKTDTGVPHIGPVAQDFHAAFGLGSDNLHIATVDADGIALAAIQGLKQVVDEKDAEIDSLKGKVAAMEARFAALEEALKARN